MKRTFLSILVLTAVLMTACGESAPSTPVVEAVSDEAPSNTVTAEGTLLPASSAELAFAQGGVVSEILVQPGENVKQGDVIVRLVGIESVQAELAAARLELAASEKALDDLIEARDSDFAEAVIRLKEVQEDYDRAEDYLTYLQTNLYVPQANLEVKRKQSQQLGFIYEHKYSFFKGPATSDMILEAENDLALHKAELDMARHDHDLLKDGPDAEQLPVLEARINAARANVAAAEATMELYELRAPFAGTLLSHDLTVGETALPMIPVAFIADTSRWIVKTKDLAEVDVAGISVDDLATVKFDAFPDEEYMGIVTRIDPVGKVYLGDMTYQITVTLDESDPGFLWNMTAVVTIYVEGTQE